jgi:hypothetical protein
MDDQTLIMYALGLIVFLFLIRDVLCWFWKINKIVARLESIDANLKAVISREASPQ